MRRVRLDNVRSEVPTDAYVEIIQEEKGISNRPMPEYVAASSLGTTVLQGATFAEGNKITKTLAPSGGDFSTIDEMLQWLSNNHFNNAVVQVNVSAGTYTAGSGGSLDYVFGSGNGIFKLNIVGAGRSTTIFNINSTNYFMELRNCAVYIQGITLNSVQVGSPYCFGIFGAELECHTCAFNDFYEVTDAYWGAIVKMNFTNINGCSYAIWMGSHAYGYFNQCNFDNNGETISIGGHCWVDINGGSFTNNDYGPWAGSGGQIRLSGSITLSGNGQDYGEVGLNKISTNGSLIANGGLTKSGTGETTGFTAGTGTSVNDDSTFTGNVGATAYNLNDVVKALKQYGILAE